VKSPATDTVAALVATFRVFRESAPSWFIPVALIAVVGELPEAALRYYARDYFGSLVAGGGADLVAIQALGMSALLGLLFALTMQLAAVLWGFLVISEVAAGRPAGIAEGLRRTLAWRLQFSWLISVFMITTGHRLWFIGGCFLLVPFGFALTDAYERATGMAALGRAGRLGFSIGPHGGKLAVPMAIASTVLMFGIVVADVFLAGVSAVFSPAVNIGALTEVSQQLIDPTGNGADLLLRIVMAVLPEPSLTGIAVGLLLSPWTVIAQLLALTVPVVAYHDAARIDAARAQPVLGDAA
jgi:hypothetical protein